MATTGQRAVTIHALTEAQFAEILRQAEQGYPEEICGMVIGRPEAPETYQVRPVRNIANQERQTDPSGFERDARTAYRMDDREVLRVLREADNRGWDVVAFYHSHPDHDAYFSAMDRDRALRPDGQPLWPGTEYLVISVRAGLAREARYYVWDETSRDFAEVPVPFPRIIHESSRELSGANDQ
jgi:proteasome lid subunit RPN8/RPN11